MKKFKLSTYRNQILRVLAVFNLLRAKVPLFFPTAVELSHDAVGHPYSPADSSVDVGVPGLHV